MKGKFQLTILSLAASVIFSAGVIAQEQTEVSILVKKDGKVIRDTTYLFDDAAEAEQAVKMMGVLSGDDEHMEHVTYHYTTTRSENRGPQKMVFISEDGERTEINDMEGDTLVWISETGGEGAGMVKQKQIKVVISDDEGGTWNVVTSEAEVDGNDRDVMILKDEDGKMKIEKFMEEHGDGEDVKVIIIKKSGDVDADHDEDVDHDMDTDHDVEVNVRVVDKKQKD